jgi:outer membrane murein-binding lipoprotein Lpp
MKNFSLLILALGLFAMAGCSRSDKETTTVKPQSTPDVARLKADSERLQQATANAAREREKAAQASANPSATGSP